MFYLASLVRDGERKDLFFGLGRVILYVVNFLLYLSYYSHYCHNYYHSKGDK